jgi:CubicO group peptidase (beta-lactamase class C family)
MVFPLLLTLVTSLTTAQPAPVFAVARTHVTVRAPVVVSPVVVLPAERMEPAPALGAPIAASHDLASATAAGMNLDALYRAEAAVKDEVRRGGFPGAALAIGRRDQVVIERGIGQIGWDPSDIGVDPDHAVYDLASLTKVVATTTAVMLLVERGRMKLDAPVWRYLPEFRGGAKDLVTVRDLLTHTSGLPAGADIWAPTPAGSLARAIATPLQREPGVKVEYSDIGFVVLWAAAERAAGEPLHRLLDRRVFGPLEMRLTTFLPGSSCVSCVPTERRKDGTVIRGRVHDPTAYRLGGIAGNAGLFSTAHDLARFAAMMANGGQLDGVRVLKRSTIEQFTRRQPGAGTRALGWDTPARTGTGAAGLRISPRAYGHTGFTGTSLWIDPDRGTWTVLLSNRTYAPKASNQIQSVRRSVHDWVSTSYDVGPVVATGAGAASDTVTGTP